MIQIGILGLLYGFMSGKADVRMQNSEIRRDV
jgi:hypothetical protein